MAVLRATVAFEHVSGLPRDRAVNTFHVNGSTAPATLQTIIDSLIRFYNLPAVEQNPALSAWLASTLTDFVVKVYDVTVEPSGPPLAVSAPVARVGATNQSNLPAEVAACLSYQGTPAAGLVQSRRRGRIFFGPLNSNAMVQAQGQPAKPNPIMNALLRAAYMRLTTDIDPVGELVIYSRPFPGRPEGRFSKSGKPLKPLPARPGSTVDITQVWTDDAFDTQRRRGERATAKTFQNTPG